MSERERESSSDRRRLFVVGLANHRKGAITDRLSTICKLTRDSLNVGEDATSNATSDSMVQNQQVVLKRFVPSRPLCINVLSL